MNKTCFISQYNQRPLSLTLVSRKQKVPQEFGCWLWKQTELCPHRSHHPLC